MTAEFQLPGSAEIRAAALREAADRIDNEELPHDYVDMFDNGARWAARLLRRVADETATETQARPATTEWTIDACYDLEANKWHGVGGTYTDHDEAQAAFEDLPRSNDGISRLTPRLKARLVRATTTYVVEAERTPADEPAAGARQGETATETPNAEPGETDEERADREATERDHAQGNHTYCGVTCEAVFPSDMLRNTILYRAIPGSQTMLAELERRAAVEAAPGTDLPARLEAALTERYTELGNPFSRMRRQEKGPDGWPAERPVGPHHVAETLRKLLAADEPAVTMHAIPLPGSGGISACCGRPPCEFVGERVTRDPDKVTCPGPAAGARQDGAES